MNPVSETNVVPIFEEAMKTYIERSKVYGPGGFEEHGKILLALFPSGLTLSTEEEFSRWVVFNNILTKVCRYAKHLNKGGHQDSIHDLGVYSFIMEDFDARSNNRK
jgi:hypothetical protein